MELLLWSFKVVFKLCLTGELHKTINLRNIQFNFLCPVTAYQYHTATCRLSYMMIVHIDNNFMFIECFERIRQIKKKKTVISSLKKWHHLRVVVFHFMCAGSEKRESIGLIKI